ncbi:MAG: YfhO family protein [bacterium]
MRLDRKDLWIIFLFLSLIIIFFGQILFTQATYVFRDFYKTIYPTRYFVSQCVKEGCFPLWNPYLYFGYPFFASLQHGLLNPFSFFLYLFPFDIGIKLFIVWHLFLAGLFMYLLMRDFGVSQISSLIASLVYTFNSYMLSIDTFTHLTSACWTPLIFLLFNRSFYTKEKLKYIILTSISLSLQFVGEEPTILYATVIVLTLFTIAKAVMQYRKEGRIIYPSKSILILSLVVLISVGLVLFQLLPFLEAVNYSYRQEGMVYHKATKWSLPPIELLTLICPVSSGFMEFIWVGLGQGLFKGIYFGIVPFFLILVSLCEKSRKNLFWFGIFLVGIILSFGDHTPFYKFLYKYFPFFSMHRYPMKFFCMSIFAGSILAGFGFDYLLRTIREKRIKSFILLFISNLFLIFILLIWYFNLGKILWLLKINYFVINSLEKLLEIEGKYFMVYKNFFLVTTIFSLFNLLAFLTRRCRVKLNFFTTVSLIIITFDLFFFGLNLNPLVNQKLYHYQPPILKILKKDTDYFRFMIEPKTLSYYCEELGRGEQTLLEVIKTLQLSLTPNLGLMHKIYEVDGYGFLILEDYIKFYVRLGYGKFIVDPQLSKLTNVKYIISKFEIPYPYLKLVYKEEKYGEEFRLYENMSYLPRAFFVPKTRVVKDRQEILNILTSRDFDPQKEVILEEEIPNSKSKISNLKSQIRIIDYQPNKVTINTSCYNDGFLFLSDTYYPGWKAYIDGKPTKIYRANFLFRAIVLPQGSHHVKFVYIPLSFKIELLGTLITIISLLGFLIFRKRKK